MASAGFHGFGIFIASIGFAGDVIVCVLPMWKVSVFIGNSIVTTQIFWEGLWMICMQQSTGHMQCQFHTSMPQDLKAARALVVISIVVVFLGLLALAGAKCTNCIEDDLAKSWVIAAGVLFILGGILCLIPVSWSANEVIKTFYDPLMHDALKGELGAALFIGWGSASLLIISGAVLCCQQKKDGRRYSVKYSAPRSAAYV